MNKILLATSYLGPVQYFSKISAASDIQIEQYDNYQKQTYRNRCTILGGNGVIDLIIPVLKQSGKRTQLKDVQIENITKWQLKHWKTIVSAYNSSPFFEYYRDDFEPLFYRKFNFLLDFNLQLTKLVLDLLELEVNVELTSEFIKSPDFDDFREIISPKFRGTDQHFIAKKYTQTFHEKFGFISNLSIVDLLFNKGPETTSVLESCYTNYHNE